MDETQHPVGSVDASGTAWGVCIVIPAFNEGPRIYAAAIEVLIAIEDCGTSHIDEIVLVDDASTDNTLDEMKRFLHDHEERARIRIESLPRNRGVGIAFLTGVHSTSQQSVSLIPGDGVFPNTSINALLQRREGGLVLSERRERHRENRTRRTLSRGFAIWFSWLVGKKVPDPHSIYILPTDLVISVANSLWGEWNPRSSTRLDNSYHLSLLIGCLEETPVGALVQIQSLTHLESQSQVFKWPFLVSFARKCMALSLGRVKLQRELGPGCR